jgi:hypothetical protein
MIKRLESINLKFTPIDCSALICGRCGNSYVALTEGFIRRASRLGWRWDSKQKAPLCPDCVKKMREVKKGETR